MASHYFPLYSFRSKFKKTKVLNKPVSDKTYEYFTALNTDYADFIKEEGFCSYAGGLFSTVDPLDYADMLSLPGIGEATQVRQNIESGWAVPLVKTGFGDFVFCDLKVNARNDIYYSFYNEKYNMGSDVGYFLEMQLTDSEFLSSSFKKRLFNQAVKKFGEPKADENFGFPMDFPWDKEKDLEKIDNVLVYKTLDYFNQLSAKHAPVI
jgi:hypothetical protein